MDVERAGAPASGNPPNIGAEYEIVVRDKNGNEKHRVGGKANCFVRGFMDMLWRYSNNGYFRHGTATPIRDTTGVWRTEHMYYGAYRGGVGGLRCNAGEGDVSMGIVLGRGVLPVTLEDYTLDFIGAGELNYGSVVISDVLYDGPVATITISRFIENVREEPVTGISEIGLCAKNIALSPSFLLIRDTFPTFSVASGDIVVATYKLVFNGGS